MVCRDRLFNDIAVNTVLPFIITGLVGQDVPPCQPGTHVGGITGCKSCPGGSFQPLPTYEDFTVCRPCFPGYFCYFDGATLPSTPCTAGLICRGTSLPPSRRPEPCPENYFCMEGDSEPRPCPEGLVSRQASSTIYDCKVTP